jgi:hypothetical protein
MTHGNNGTIDSDARFTRALKLYVAFNMKIHTLHAEASRLGGDYFGASSWTPEESRKRNRRANRLELARRKLMISDSALQALKANMYAQLSRKKI